MSHRAVTIVIPAWNEWDLTRACLDSLRPTLGQRDQVVVVDNGSADGTAAGLARYPWVDVVSNAENRGFAAGCNQGAALARNDVVIFLNNDTLVPSRWLEGLSRPFDDGSIGATGPRSNFVSGPQLLPAGTPYPRARLSDIQRFARAWREEHRGETTEVTRLIGFCLAVRTELFRELGGFDEGFGIGGFEDDDLCARIVESGARLLITHESFVHHHGHRTFDANGLDWLAIQEENKARYAEKRAAARATPLVSACLIVKDEEELLGDCLASIAGFADEIVVYDTGSTDSTPEIARAAGATVVNGYWDDDFARARNAALDHCTGEWILHIDADETLHGDLDAMRGLLVNPAAPDLLLLPIDNVGDDGGIGMRHRGHRLFRRTTGHWVGRLHEQVVSRSADGRLRTAGVDVVSLHHVGYRTDVVARKGKQERNVRVAEAGQSVADDRAAALRNLAASLSFAGRYEEALEKYAAARRAGDASPSLERRCLQAEAGLLLDLGRPAECLTIVEELRRLGAPPNVPDYYEGVARLALGDAAGAAAVLATVTELVDEEGQAYPVATLHQTRGAALAASGRLDEAADELLSAVRDTDTVAPVWRTLAELTVGLGRDLAELAALVTPHQLLAVLGQLQLADPLAADALAEQLWTRLPSDPRLLAFVAGVGWRFPTARALEWSSRLREAGLIERCPLVARASNETVAPAERLRSACAAAGSFADARGPSLVRQVAALVPETELSAALADVDLLAPTLVVAFIEAAATTPARCLALARALEGYGAREEALAVLDHGFQDGPVEPSVADEARAWLASLGTSLPALSGEAAAR